MENPIRTSHPIKLTRTRRLALLVLFALVFNLGYGQSAARAINGILDLRSYQWKEGLADLNGEWAFYWHQLYTPSTLPATVGTPNTYATVPGFWNSLVPDEGFFKPAFGYATYRLKVLCPPSTNHLALKFLTVASAYKLFVNGQQLAEIGKVGTTSATAKPAFQPQIVPVTPINNELDILIQVANFTYNNGGLWDFIKLGTQQQVDTYWVKDVSQDFFIAGSFFLIGIFYFVIYFFFRRRKLPLYFAVFCLLIGMRSLVTGELGINYVMPWSWQLTKRTEFLFLYLTVPVLSLFSFGLFPREFSKNVLRSILLISVPFVAFALFTSPFIFRYTLRFFQVFMVLTACYGLYVYVSAVKKRRVGSVYFLAGFVVLFITIINDILKTSLIIRSTNMLYSGLYILVICQATALSRQYFQAFIKVEKLNKQLELKNNELEQKNETINKTNEELNKLNAELDNLVFRTSHDLRSPITSMFAMAEVIKMEEDAAVRNDYIDFQKKSLRRLDSMITEILQYARNKSTALQCEQIHLEEFVKNILQDHRFSYDSEKIERIVEVHQPGEFNTDKMRLSIILNNLISNGLKHHNKEQEHPYLKIKVNATEKQAIIEVEDNGQGIAPNHLDHIFTIFYRVNTNATGSGFGLYIVKEAVQKLGGTINVQSKLNVGTRFTIVIPNGAPA